MAGNRQARPARADRPDDTSALARRRQMDVHQRQHEVGIVVERCRRFDQTGDSDASGTPPAHVVGEKSCQLGVGLDEQKVRTTRPHARRCRDRPDGRPDRAPEAAQAPAERSVAQRQTPRQGRDETAIANPAPGRPERSCRAESRRPAERAARGHDHPVLSRCASTLAPFLHYPVPSDSAPMHTSGRRGTTAAGHRIPPVGYLSDAGQGHGAGTERRLHRDCRVTTVGRLHPIALW